MFEKVDLIGLKYSMPDFGITYICFLGHTVASLLAIGLQTRFVAKTQQHVLSYYSTFKGLKPAYICIRKKVKYNYTRYLRGMVSLITHYFQTRITRYFFLFI